MPWLSSTGTDIDGKDANATRDELEIVASRLEPVRTPPMPPQPSGVMPERLTRLHVSDELLTALGLTADNLRQITVELFKATAPRTAGAASILAQIETAGAPEAQTERVRAALANLS
jgi:hypothetical protein